MEQIATCTECVTEESQVLRPCKETYAFRCVRCSRVEEIGWTERWLLKDTLVIYDSEHLKCPEVDEKEIFEEA